MKKFAQGGNLGTFDILFIMMFWTYPEKISLVPIFSGSNYNALGLEEDMLSEEETRMGVSHFPKSGVPSPSLPKTGCCHREKRNKLHP